MTIKELEETQHEIRRIYSSMAGIWTRLNEMKEYKVGTEEDYQKMQDQIAELEKELYELENKEI